MTGFDTKETNLEGEEQVTESRTPLPKPAPGRVPPVTPTPEGPRCALRVRHFAIGLLLTSSGVAILLLVALEQSSSPEWRSVFLC